MRGDFFEPAASENGALLTCGRRRARDHRWARRCEVEADLDAHLVWRSDGEVRPAAGGGGHRGRDGTELGGDALRRRQRRPRAASPSATRSPASSRRSSFESGADGRSRARCSSSSTPASSARSWPRPSARSDLAATNAEPLARARRDATRSPRRSSTPTRRSCKTLAAPTSARSQAQIERKIVRAPFAGRLGIRAVNLGQYLNPGTPITVLESIDAVFVDFTAAAAAASPTSRSACRSASTIDGRDGAAARRHDRRASTRRVDSTTRTIKLRASVPNTRRASSAPACSSTSRSSCREGASGRRRPGHRDRPRVVRRLGLRRRGQEGRRGHAGRPAPTASRPRSRASSSCASARRAATSSPSSTASRPGRRSSPPAPSSCATARRVVVNNDGQADARSSTPHPENR